MDIEPREGGKDAFCWGERRGGTRTSIVIGTGAAILDEECLQRGSALAEEWEAADCGSEERGGGIVGLPAEERYCTAAASKTQRTPTAQALPSAWPLHVFAPRAQSAIENSDTKTSVEVVRIVLPLFLGFWHLFPFVGALLGMEEPAFTWLVFSITFVAGQAPNHFVHPILLRFAHSAGLPPFVAKA